MKVLGLNGVYPRSHDASACLIEGDQITAYAEEERFVRSKKAFDLQPENAINYCLDESDINVNEIDAITYGWLGAPLTAQDVLPAKFAAQLTTEIPIVQIEHHEAHAASVFFTSPFEESAVLVVDGQGETESTSIWRGTKDGLEKVASFDINQSLGYLYGAVSNYCGLGSFGAGKIMGLAPYGDPKYTDVLREVYQSIQLPKQTGHDSQDAFYGQFLGKLHARGFPRSTYEHTYDPLTLKQRKEPILEDVHRDMAASVQVLLEEEIMQLVGQAKQLTGSNFICLAGGVAMNCVSNSVVQDSGLFEDVFIQPGCEDCGVALGSAVALIKEKVPLTSVYTGPSFSDEEVGIYLKNLRIRSTKHDSIADKAASLLADNIIIGWFQGGLEYGPRALGGRSILANPATTEMRDEVNRVKSREPWRPFGPSVLAERAADLFENPHESNYMLRSFAVRKAWRSRLAAVVHVDGSTRPQTVRREDNPCYYDLIKSFDNITGTPGILNTSFNNYDEPIVASPLDAIRTFYSTNLGALVLGNHLILK